MADGRKYRIWFQEIHKMKHELIYSGKIDQILKNKSFVKYKMQSKFLMIHEYTGWT